MKIEQLFPHPQRRPKFVFRSSDRLDPTVFANACVILGIQEDQATDLKLVAQKYVTIVKHYHKRIPKVPQVFVEDMFQSLQETHTSYQTIKEQALKT